MTLSRRSLLTLVAIPAWGRNEKPPTETGDFRQPSLTEVSRLDRTIGLDLRFATRNNFAGRPLYDKAKAYLQRPAAEALVLAHRKMKTHGYGMLVLDAYRPWSVTRDLWETAPKEKRKLLANPKKGSIHNRGCSVDVTLYDLNSGKAVKMPGGPVELSDHAVPDLAGTTPQERAARDLLGPIMTAQGFTADESAWWHFDHKDWRRYRILNIEFSELR